MLTDRMLVWGSGSGKPAAQFTCLVAWHVRVLSWSLPSSLSPRSDVLLWEFKTQQYETDTRPVWYFHNTFVNVFFPLNPEWKVR
jgi:hypothetical protein